MRRTRSILPAACLALSCGMPLAVVGTTATAAPAAGARSHPATVRHIVYLTAGDRIMSATVAAGGTVTANTRIAPAPGTPAADRPYDVVVSPDGQWLGWAQGRGENRRPLLYLRNLRTGDTTTIATNKDPVGFAGDTLLATFNKTFRLLVTPSPHFDYVPHAGIALDGWARGAVDTSYAQNTHSGTLQLTTWSGAQIRLHRYTDFGAPDYRTIDGAWVSSDDRKLLVERGNHQDFDGLGPNSLVDEFALTGHHHRAQLGHYPGSQVWRVSGAAFRGSGDLPYTAWEAQTRTGVRALVARFSAGRWVRVQTGAIAVAADARNDLLLQPGRYLPAHARNNPSDYPTPWPSAFGTLRIGRTNHSLAGVKGIEFWFTAG